MTSDHINCKKLSRIDGIRLASCSAGIYKEQRPDLALIEINEDAACSAVFTNNAFIAAPVFISRKHIKSFKPRYFIINAGNANAGMGDQGIRDAYMVCNELAGLAKCDVNSILPFSTGVIGEQLPVDKIINNLQKLLGNLHPDNWLDVANAIITTDTCTKGISKVVNIGGDKITITGVAKGSGMIKPDMATMLAYIATDAKIDGKILDEILKYAVNQSFNCITVDGDTSTNDACVLIATGKNKLNIINESRGDIYLTIRDAITEVFIYLAQSIIKDGEGATKFIEINVNNGNSTKECKSVAYNIAHSPLVKTALFASDPNWGRILAAIGKTDIEDFNIYNVNMNINGTSIITDGKRSDNYSEKIGRKILKEKNIYISVNLNRGKENVTIWTTDLSYDYVKINAEYRT